MSEERSNIEELRLNEHAPSVQLDDVWQDADFSRPDRRLKVVDVDDDVVRVVNLDTQKMTKIRLDRFRPHTGRGHGYILIQRPGAPQPRQTDVEPSE